MKKIYKGIVLSFILFCTITICGTKIVKADTNIASGSRGTMNWVIDSTGKLKITGTGDMPNFIYEFDEDDNDWDITIPWYDYRSQITSIEIGDGITSIGNYAFYYTNATSITMGNITKIGERAFKNSKITAINLPSTLVSIGKEAFQETNLVTVTIPSSVTSLGNNAFYKCSSLTEIKILANITTIPDGLCEYCNSLSKITIPSTVTSMRTNAFGNHAGNVERKVYYKGTSPLDWAQISFTNIDSNPLWNNGNGSDLYIEDYNSGDLRITLKPSISGVNSYAFVNCKNLTSLSSSNNWFGSIGSNAFYKCENLSCLSLYKGASSIGTSAFQYCTNLSDVTWETKEYTKTIGTSAFDGCTKITRWSFPSSASIGSYAFRGSGLTNIYFSGKAPSSASNYCFSGVTANLYYKPGSSWDIISTNYWGGSFTKIKYGYENKGGVSYYLNDEDKLILTGTGDVNITEHADNPFQLRSIKSISVPEGVTTLGATKYAGNSVDINTITVPSSVTDLRLNGAINPTNVILLGDIPSISSNSLVKTNTVYYNIENATYTSENMLDYGGTNVAWTPYCTIVDGNPMSHNLTHVEAKNATYTEVGNIEYWKCSLCNKYFADEDAINEITADETIIAPLTYKYQLTTRINTPVVVNETIKYAFTVNNSFSSGEFTVTYNPELVSFASVDNDALYNDNENGTVVFSRYGGSDITGFTLNFKAIKDGNAEFNITDAKFSTKTDAETKDLDECSVESVAKTVVIKKEIHSITLPEIFEGEATVRHNASYTFRAKDNEHYSYSNLSATYSDGVELTITNNGDGTWTTASVLDDFVITATRIGKLYNISYTTTTDALYPETPRTANYGETTSFELPSEEDWAYMLTSLKCGDEDVAYTNNRGIIEFVMPAGVEATIDRQTRNLSVSVEGNAASDVAVPEGNKYIYNTDYTFAVNEDPNYTYTITAQVYGEDTEVIKCENNKYTISKPGYGGIVITATKKLNNGNIGATKYVTLDGKSVWLIKNDIAKVQGKRYVYKGTSMYWSEKYEAYCLLVVSDVKPTVEENMFTLKAEAAEEIVYDMDVNMTEHVDSNDAQLVWNMYNAEYTGFTENVTIMKYFKADVNGDGEINVTDASAIVNSVLNITE